MMLEGWVALVALVVVALVLLVRWADARYQDARRRQRREVLDSVSSAE